MECITINQCLILTYIISLLLVTGTASVPLLPTSQPTSICTTEICQKAASMLLKYINFSVNPCDDFYEFSCGRWIAENPIPSTASVWSADDILNKEVDRITQEILTSPVHPSDFKPVAQAKQYFSQCVDRASLNKRGLQPVLDILNSYGGWPAITGDWKASNFNLTKIIADANSIYTNFFMQEKEKTYLLLKIVVAEDLRNTTKRMIVLDQPHFSVAPAVLLNQEEFPDMLSAFKTLFLKIAKSLIKLTGAKDNVPDSKLSTEFDEIIAFEARLVNASTDEELRNDFVRMYNRIQINVLEDAVKTSDTKSTTTPTKHEDTNHAKLDWKVLLDTMFANSNFGVTIDPQEELLVNEPDYISNLIEILETTPIYTVANYVMWRFAYGLVGYTTEEMHTNIFQYRKVALGLQEGLTWETGCAALTPHLGFGMAIGVKYIERAFDKEAKRDLDDMTDILKGAFGQLLDEADWMDDNTRMKAKVKISAVTKLMAFPDWLFNQTRLEIEYEGLELSSNYLDSTIALSKWLAVKNLKTLREPTDKAAWQTYPGVVNAQYIHETNAVQFPAGNIAPPYYLRNGPKFLNYGGIGAIIGHELTHALDITGSQYDAEGNLHDWWSPSTHDKFDEKAKCFVEQYSAFNTTEGAVQGNLTSSENIADNGGLREALHAYNNWIKLKNDGREELTLPGFENFTPQQLFFIGYGISWCTNMTSEEVSNYLQGFHSPPQFRVIGPIQNSHHFGNTFNCSTGTYMNPPVEKKCMLW